MLSAGLFLFLFASASATATCTSASLWSCLIEVADVNPTNGNLTAAKLDTAIASLVQKGCITGQYFTMYVNGTKLVTSCDRNADSIVTAADWNFNATGCGFIRPEISSVAQYACDVCECGKSKK